MKDKYVSATCSAWGAQGLSGRTVRRRTGAGSGGEVMEETAPLSADLQRLYAMVTYSNRIMLNSTKDHVDQMVEAMDVAFATL